MNNNIFTFYDILSEIISILEINESINNQIISRHLKAVKMESAVYTKNGSENLWQTFNFFLAILDY